MGNQGPLLPKSNSEKQLPKCLSPLTFPDFAQSLALSPRMTGPIPPADVQGWPEAQRGGVCVSQSQPAGVSVLERLLAMRPWEGYFSVPSFPHLSNSVSCLVLSDSL